MKFDFKSLHIELYLDLNVNVECFCLDDEQKEELKKKLEKYWHENHKEDLLREANDIVFKIRVKELLDE